MNHKLVAVGFALAVLNGGSASAQWLGPTWHTNIELTGQDRAIVVNKLQQEIHGRRAPAVAHWSNPDSGHTGTIKLMSNYVRQGMPCERIEYRIRSTKGEPSERYVFNSCRLPDGSWKLAE